MEGNLPPLPPPRRAGRSSSKSKKSENSSSTSLNDNNQIAMTKAEREAILNVLARNEELKSTETARIQNLKERSVASSRFAPDRGNVCASCGGTLPFSMTVPLVAELNKCSECSKLACHVCRVDIVTSGRSSATSGNSWRCRSCAAQAKIKMTSGEWFKKAQTMPKSSSASSAMQLVLDEVGPMNKRSSTSCDNKEDNSINLTPEPSISSAERMADGIHDDISQTSSLMDDTSSRSRASSTAWKNAAQKSLTTPGSDNGSRQSSMRPNYAPYRSVTQGAKMFELVKNAVKHDQVKMANAMASTLPVPGARRLVSQRSVKSINESINSSHGAFTPQGVPLNMDILENPYERGYTYQDIINLRRQFEFHSQSLNESMEGNGPINDIEMEDVVENPMLYKSELEIATPSLSPCEPRHSPNSTIINQDFLDDHEDEQLDSLYLPSEVQGEISYSLSYNSEELSVFIGRVFELDFTDKRRRMDFQVKVFLLPDRSTKKKTRHRPYSPVISFSESFKFPLKPSQLTTSSVELCLSGKSTFVKSNFMGQMTVPLSSFDFSKLDGIERIGRLRPRVNLSSYLAPYKGDLSIELTYLPNAPASTDAHSKPCNAHSSFPHRSENGVFRLCVLLANNLIPSPNSSSSGARVRPFLKIHLYPFKWTKKKTVPSDPTDLCPEFNSTFQFRGMTKEILADCSLEISVWDYEKNQGSYFLGGVRCNLGTGHYQGQECDWMDGQDSEVKLWQAMLDSPGKPVSDLLPLRDSLVSRIL